MLHLYRGKVIILNIHDIGAMASYFWVTEQGIKLFKYTTKIK